MNKYIKFFFLLVTISLLIQSCTRAEDEITEIEPIKCTQETPFGICDKKEDFCYNGKCIPLGTKCGERLAPCEDNTDLCIEDTENGGFKCVEGRCNFNNTDGTCPTDDMICTQRGLCENKCNSNYPKGACSTGNTCVDGTCFSNDEICGPGATDGICTAGKTCAYDAISDSYKCQDSCGENFPSGACESTKTCKYNKCYFDYELCSVDKNLDGICEDGKLCDNGICKRVCSSVVTNGICEYEDQICFEGNCGYRCSTIRPTGICEEVGTKCVEGECKFKCSQTIQDGYCTNENETCLKGYCKPICSPTEITGACPDVHKTCDEGECKFECSEDHIFGICLEDGYGCQEGNCIEQCSNLFPDGACEQFFTCNNGTCEEIPCSQLNPHGPCSETNQKCIDGICLNECSPQQPNGWCTEEGYVCNNNSCIDPETQPCSILFQNGFCSAWDEECITGGCLKKECSPTYEHGRCTNGAICNNGVCSLSCLDDRPILQEGETHNVDNGGISGSCCVVNEDCKDGFNSYGKFPTNVCIYDSNREGPYCIGMHLAKNNEPYICHYAGGCDGCMNDSECTDPYPNKGTEEDYFCSMITFYDFAVQTGDSFDINISYCQRVMPNCQRLDKQQGEPCNEDCHDAECATGLHCIKGFCTGQCKNQSYCSESTDCIPLAYHLPDTDKDLYLDICLVTCENDGRCNSILGNNYSCSTFTYEKKVLPEETPTPMISYCRPLDSNADFDLGRGCDLDSDCKKRICGEQNVCTTICKENEDCGNNAFCSYTKLMTGEIIHENAVGTPIDLNYLGICKYLDSDQGVVNPCTKKDNCPDNLIDGEEYHCLPKIDLLKNLPEGNNSGDAAYGVCGVLKKARNKAYSSLGRECNNITQLCETDLCICGNGLCKNGDVGKCRDYCETSSDCDEDKYCKRILLRDQVQYSREVYAGVCEERRNTVYIGSQNNCDINANSSSSLCSSDKTCIANPVNTKPDPNNPNKFGVEYICIEKQQGRVNLNQTCSRDRDCNSNLCNLNTNKCSHACTNDSQCDDVGLVKCENDHILVEDLNTTYSIYSGICK